MISAKIIGDSINTSGDRITSMIVTFPRFILAELNTHRMFSRNSASSRAIPFEKMVKSVEENPFIPIAWQQDHKGMQGTKYITNKIDVKLNTNAWLKARDNAISSAQYLNYGVKEGRDNGVTKQLCNRLLEPFMWHTVIVTATEWENFFSLRCPRYETSSGTYRSKIDACDNDTEEEGALPPIDDTLAWLRLNKGQAEIHMMALAERMYDVYVYSTPKKLKDGEWHIPYEELIIEKYGLTQDIIEPKFNRPLSLEVSSMMAARTSYTIVGDDGKEWSLDKYREKHNELITANPLHASPLEHCAKAMSKRERDLNIRGKLTSIDHSRNPMAGHFDVGIEDYPEDNIKGWCGNFRGFIQYRKFFDKENIL